MSLWSTSTSLRCGARFAGCAVVAILSISSRATAGDFSQTAGPTGGNVLSIAMRVNEAWASTSAGSIFHSVDSGATWSRVPTTGLPNNAMLEQIIALHGSVLLVRDRVNIYRSVDDAATWTLLNVDFSNTSSSALIPDGPAVVALLKGATTSDSDRLLRTTDDGATWIDVPLPFTVVSDVFFKDDVLLVSGLSFNDGVHRSLNFGANWTQLGAELPQDQYKRLATGQPSLVLQCLFSGRFFHSTNIGSTWDEITPPFAGGFFLQPTGVADGGQTMYAAFTEQSVPIIYSSTDDGITWQSTNASGLPAQAVSSSLRLPMATDFAAPLLLGYGFSGLGVFRSTDGGTQWTESNAGLIATTLDAVGVVGSTLLASEPFDAGNFISLDNGATWLVETALADIQTYEALNETTVFAGSRSSGIFRSTDAGQSWSAVNTGLPHYGSTAGDAIEPINDIVSHNGFLFAATGGGSEFIAGDDHCGCTSAVSGDGVYRSANNGASWQRVSNGLPITMLYFGEPILRPITALHGVNGTLLAATRAHGVFRSANNGSSWAPATGTPGGTDFVAFQGNVYLAGADGSLYTSSDDGQSWLTVATDLPGNFTFTRLHVHHDRLHAIAGSTQHAQAYGIYSSNDASNWTSATTALSDVVVSDITSHGGDLVVAAVGRGVWTQPDTSAADIDNNGSVDIFDLLAVLKNWGACEAPCPPTCPADVTGNCTIDIFDLVEVLSAWSN